MTTIRTTATASLALAATAALAQDQVFHGDPDGFGFGAPETQGELFRSLGGSFFGDFRDPDDLADAPSTDVWDAFPGGIVTDLEQLWTFDYDPDDIAEANLHFYGAGFGDIGPVELTLDGEFLATLEFPGQFETTQIIDIDIDADRLDGDTTIEMRAGRDGYIIDYARLDLTRDDCRPDLDGDGELTIFDFLEFQNLFDAMDPAADFDDDGEFTLFDFLAFQNAFDVGCG